MIVDIFASITTIYTQMEEEKNLFYGANEIVMIASNDTHDENQ